jgi:hypothetical protein
VSATLGGIAHIILRPKLDLEATVPKIRLEQGIDCTTPLLKHLGIWHESETKAKEFKNTGLSSPSASNQTIQPIGELQFHTRQKAACNMKAEHHMVGRVAMTLGGSYRHIATDQTFA